MQDSPKNWLLDNCIDQAVVDNLLNSIVQASGFTTFIQEPLEQSRFMASSSPPVPSLCQNHGFCRDSKISCGDFFAQTIRQSLFIRPFIVNCPFGLSFAVSPLVFGQQINMFSVISGYVRTKPWSEHQRTSLECWQQKAGAALSDEIPVVPEKKIRAVGELVKKTSEYIMSLVTLQDKRFNDCIYSDFAAAREILRKSQNLSIVEALVAYKGTFTWKHEKELIEQVALGKRKEAMQKLEEIITTMYTDYQGSPEEFKGRIMELAVIITRTPLYYMNYSDGEPVNIRMPEFYPPSGYDKIELMHWLMIILEMVLDITDCRKHGQQKANVVRAAIGYINSNLEQRLRVEDVSKAVGFTAQYLNRLFIEQMGISASEYIAKAKIQESKRLLKESGMSITEISNRLNYWDSTHFAKIFRKSTGKSPSEFRDHSASSGN